MRRLGLSIKDELQGAKKAAYTRLIKSVGKQLYSDADLLATNAHIGQRTIGKRLQDRSNIIDKITSFEIERERELKTWCIFDLFWNNQTKDGKMSLPDFKETVEAELNGLIENLPISTDAALCVVRNHSKWDDCPQFVVNYAGPTALTVQDVLFDLTTDINDRRRKLCKSTNEHERKIKLYKKLKEELGDDV